MTNWQFRLVNGFVNMLKLIGKAWFLMGYSNVIVNIRSSCLKMQQTLKYRLKLN